MAKKKMAQRDKDIVQASMTMYHVPSAWDELLSGQSSWNICGWAIKWRCPHNGNGRFEVDSVSYAYTCKWVAAPDHLSVPPKMIWQAHFARLLLQLRAKERGAE